MLNWMFFNFRNMIRDKSSIFFVIVFPILLTAILGNMLAELDNPDTPIGTISIAVYSEEPEIPAGAGLEKHMGLSAENAAVSAFIETLAGHDGIEIAKTTNADAARSEVESGSADAAMIFKSPLEIEVSEGSDIYKNRAVMLMAQSFSREYAALKTAALHDTEAFMMIMQKNSGEIPIATGLSADKDLGVSRTMIDYYAVTMIVMIIFMGGGIGGASSVFTMRQDGSLRRISASPRSRTRLFLESVIGTVPQNIMQAGIVMILAVSVLGAQYANTWQGNLLIFAYFMVLGIAVSSVFMLVGLFVKVNPYIPLLAILWALLFMSGSFSKDMVVEGFSEYLPMNIAQNAIFDYTLFGRPGQLLLVLGVSAVIICLTCAAGSVLYRRKETMF